MAHINLDTEQTMEADVKNKLQQVVWCCGDLRTGAISIGVTCIVSSILLSLYFIESELQDRFSINIIVVCLLTLFLIVSDVGLVYGATKHYKWLTMPWMGLHLALVIFLVFHMAINYQSMKGTNGAACKRWIADGGGPVDTNGLRKFHRAANTKILNPCWTIGNQITL